MPRFRGLGRARSADAAHQLPNTMSSRIIEVHSRRVYSAHHILLRIAKDSLSKATAKAPGWADHQFVSIALSSLAVEALCNAVGERAVPDWKDFESCSPKAKLRIICKYLNIDFKRDKEPWAAILWLSSLRNQIAHPKAEHVEQKTEVSESEHSNRHYRDAPKSSFEKQITLNNAERAVSSVKKVVEIFATNLPVDKQFGIYTDSWATSASAKKGG